MKDTLQPPFSLFGPVIEKHGGEERFLRDDPVKIIKSGQFYQVPLITGITRDEFNWRAQCKSCANIIFSQKKNISKVQLESNECLNLTCNVVSSPPAHHLPFHPPPLGPHNFKVATVWLLLSCVTLKCVTTFTVPQSVRCTVNLTYYLNAKKVWSFFIFELDV